MVVLVLAAAAAGGAPTASDVGLGGLLLAGRLEPLKLDDEAPDSMFELLTAAQVVDAFSRTQSPRVFPASALMRAWLDAPAFRGVRRRRARQLGRAAGVRDERSCARQLPAVGVAAQGFGGLGVL